MKNSKVLLVISLLLVAMLFATNAFAATPTPTKKPTPTKTPFITPTKTPNVTPSPTRTPNITPIPTISYRLNVHATNKTNIPANDLEIFIKGNVQVLDWWRDPAKCPFLSMTFWYDPVLDITIVRYYDGICYPGQEANNCIFLNQNIQEYSLRKWSTDGVPGAAVGATLSVDFQPAKQGLAAGVSGVEPGPVGSALDVTITNSPVDGGDETIAVLQIGAAKRPYSFAELTWANPVLDQEVTWIVNLTSVHLQKGGSLSIPAIQMTDPAAGLVYRLKVSLDSEASNNIIEYVGQFAPGSISVQ